ncbi:PepSY-associated TM helix domain-containing protein [Paracraurococcus lichenis]|uniref:PepSY-associated TM helix domain-containing protein n=1 Tax=Paracraurococcus lichenis TaxID=3064888 RepID=A0ABT9DYW2_9PROT|nr:PepSY-associated TM helix domain-containing protein [Paracraurococcus sp. LOR1-02]MDO9709102.1 PepSY-associated TM helix domain-containing protein [Paracraurococcus sp. LOR1-02]
MRQGFRQCMAWLHTWAGLIPGWILFAVFLTGTAAYYRGEISTWMRPELRLTENGPDTAAMAIRELQRIAPGATGWFIGLPTESDPLLRLYWRPAGERRFRDGILDPATGRVAQAGRSMGGEFFYRFHFELHMPPIWGRWIVCLCAMAMLVAILSGVITHRRIFADFFTFRPGKAGHRSWLDAHNALAVLALPYHLMITYTGLLTLVAMFMPWGMQAAYKGDQQAFFAEALSIAPTPRPAGQAAPLTDIAPLVAEAMRRWPEAGVRRIGIAFPGDANATVVLGRGDRHELAIRRQELVFSGTAGELRGATGITLPAARTVAVAFGLHFARFELPFLHLLFFLSGLAGTAMVGTGLVMWVAKRAPKRGEGRHAGLRLAEALNMGTVFGLPVAMLGFFWANRLLPAMLDQRPEWEIRIFFALWLAAYLHAALRPGRRGWAEQAAAAALLGLLLPVLNGLTTRHHLGASLPAGDWLMAGMDLGFLGFGLGFALAARRLWRAPRPAAAEAPPGRLRAEGA